VKEGRADLARSVAAVTGGDAAGGVPRSCCNQESHGFSIPTEGGRSQRGGFMRTRSEILEEFVIQSGPGYSCAPALWVVVGCFAVGSARPSQI
jgi:hypothetical protein